MESGLAIPYPIQVLQYKKKQLLLFGILFLLILLSTPKTHARSNTNIYFGNLHNHTSITDGSLKLEDFIKEVKLHSDYDFVSITEHTGQKLKKEFKKIKRLSAQNKYQKPIILFGQEFADYKLLNLITVQNYPKLISRKNELNYKGVFENIAKYKQKFPNRLIVAEFNHPRDTINDYGFKTNFDSNKSAFRDALDPHVQLISIDSNKMMGGRGDKDYKKLPEQIHQYRKITNTDAWFHYLLMGMHLAPKVDTAVHSKFPGRIFAARTAIWVDGELNKKSLLKALYNRRSYASEDLNLKIFAKVNSKHFPGVILKRKETKQLTIEFSLEDPDEKKARYQIDIYKGDLAKQTIKKLPSRLTKKITTKQFRLSVSDLGGNKLFFISKVTQFSLDPINGSKKNVAWLAPVWIE